MYYQIKNIRKFILTLSLIVASSIINAQQFTETTVSTFNNMEINYGNAVADYDLDGDLDMFIVGYNAFNPSDPTTWSRLLNNKGFRFEDATVKAGFSQQYSNGLQGLKLGASWGDYDNDDYPDLLLAHQNGTQLYHNMKDGTFTDVTESTNIVSCNDCNNIGSLWWDYDNDGNLDLYLYYLGQPNRLYHNKGDGTFEEINGALNLNDSNRTWSCLPIDANRDGWMDLYVINDFGLSNFYINNNGLSFTDATIEYNLKNTGCGMGSTIGDYNNDGYFDIYVTNIAESKSNPLFMGTEEGPFINKTVEEGVENGHFGWGTRFLDADNDGDQDIYVVNGNNDLNYNNNFFKNLRSEGEERFVDWTEQSSANGFANGMGAEVFDYDNDGDLDILVSNTNDAPYLYKNTTANGNEWLQVNLEGTTINRNAYGTKASAYTNGKAVHRLLHGATIMGQSIKPLHFGMGDIKKIDSLIISWPNKQIEKIYNLATNQKIKVKQNNGMIEGQYYIESSEPIEEEGEEEEEEEEEISQPSDTSTDIVDIITYPNPFNETKSIAFNMEIKEAGLLTIDIYSVTGLKVFNYKEEISQPIDNWISYWDGKDSNGLILPSGMYVYKLSLGKDTWNGKLLFRH